MRRFLIFLLILSTSTLFAANKSLKVAACGITRVAFVKQMAKEFSQKFGIDVYVNNRGGVNRAIELVATNKADIGFGCRALLNYPIEKNLLCQRVAWGSLAVLTNAKNGVSNITEKQLQDILLGKITNWKELGGDNAKIELVLRKPGVKSGVGFSLRDKIFKNLNIKLKRDARYVINSDDIRDAIKANRYAIALGDGASDSRFNFIKILKIDGYKPNKKALKENKYPYKRPYFVYRKKKLTKEAQLFLNYILTKEGQAGIDKTGAISLNMANVYFKNLNQSINNENLNNDNTVSMNNIIKKYANEELNVFGCGITRVAFTKNAVKDFAKRYGIKVNINSKGGVVYVLDKLFTKESDVSTVCRKPFKNGREKELWCVQVAWGALGFIVNPKNPISNISKTQLKDILNGKITNWKELGGLDKSIHIYLRNGLKSGVGSTLREILFKDKNYPINSAYKLLKNSGEIRDAVSKDTYAIAVDDVTSSQRVSSVKLLNIDNIEASKRAILKGDYIYRRPFYACLAPKHRKIARVFVNYLLSSQGQKVISLSKTANLEEAKDINSQNNFILQQLKLRLRHSKE